jgi:ATP-binding cassette subfamily C protein
LLGFLKPQQGAITVDTTDIHTNLRGWLDHVGYIPQSILLLDDTVRRNIAFGIPDAEIDEEQLIMAVNAAQLAGFIESLPRGLDTVVGERGIRFSGGQRQRVGLARALYHSPDVLVMDEATSALDNSTESQVMKTLNELKEGRTFIIIAHRLSTVQECDRLFFMKDGRIEAEGTYEELSRIHLDFRRMVEVA